MQHNYLKVQQVLGEKARRGNVNVMKLFLSSSIKSGAGQRADVPDRNCSGASLSSDRVQEYLTREEIEKGVKGRNLHLGRDDIASRTHLVSLDDVSAAAEVLCIWGFAVLWLR